MTACPTVTAFLSENGLRNPEWNLFVGMEDT